MRKTVICALALCLAAALLTACGGGFQDLELKVGTLSVESASITAEGKLLTATAADRAPNDPKGQNLSPQLKWSAAEGAAYYTVCMVDTTANWIHMIVRNITKSELAAGEIDSARYVGPYPPAGSGAHEYRIEVFALRGKPDHEVGTVDQRGDYVHFLQLLDKSGGRTGNVLARGSVVGSYEHGADVA